MVVLRNVIVACADEGRSVVRDLCLASAARRVPRFEKELRDHVVWPALVNSHEHLHQNCVPPLPQTASFRNSYDWAAAFEDHFQDEAVRAALATALKLRLWHGALKNALSGVTTVMHHDPAHELFDCAHFPVHVSRPCAWAHSLHWRYGPEVAASFHAAPRSVPWFIHLAEGVDELAAGELRELRRLDCLHRNSVLIHGVGLDDADITDILRAGAGVIWCPSSNLSMLGQTIKPRPLRALFDAGRLALGTDSRLTGSRDLLAELAVAAAHSDFSPRELLRLVTAGARRLLRARASDDRVIIRAAGDPFCRIGALERAQLRAVVRDGEPVITDPDFEDWFAAQGIPCTGVTLDGQPKLCRTDALWLDGSATWVHEPGLTVP